MIQTLIADSVFDGITFRENFPVSIENGKIIAFNTLENSEIIHLKGCLVPGFIDVQVNGGGGVLFNDTPNLESLKTMSKAHQQFGTTAMLPTLITDQVSVMEAAADAMSLAIKEAVPGVIGIHFEGPHLSVPKKGIHPEHFIRELSEREMAIFSRKDLGLKIITLAPENVSTDVIKALVAEEVIVCLGHSNADFETTQAALAAGATGFTHLFNAMSPLTSRAPGVVGAALLDDNSWCGLIVDGHHVHHGASKLALKAKSTNKIMLVSDAMSTIGTDTSTFELFGKTITQSGNRLNAADGTLAGSAIDMSDAVRNTVNDLGVSLGDAINMASQTPAEFLGQQQHLGKIDIGMQADLVLLNDFDVTATWIAGRQVF